MISSIYKSEDIFFFHHNLSDIAKRIGVETNYYILKRFEKEVRIAYKRHRDFLKLKAIFKAEKLEKACARANYYNEKSFTDLIWLLDNGLEELPLNNEIDFLGQKYLDFS
ncbi:MAG: hypothetical protein JW786_02315 [Desulfobacterales bacterium]|nr:hypothetical protein [Desulfobacterales bacterium]